MCACGWVGVRTYNAPHAAKPDAVLINWWTSTAKTIDMARALSPCLHLIVRIDANADTQEPRAASEHVAAAGQRHCARALS